MSYDSRKKGCPNEVCGKHQSQYKFNAEDNFCTECGSKLVFVCARCSTPIPDEGPNHKYCVDCESERPETTVLNKAKYALKGLDYARGEAFSKAKDVTKDLKDSVSGNDVVDTIIEVGTKAVVGIGTFAIKNVEKLTKRAADDEDEEK